MNYYYYYYLGIPYLEAGLEIILQWVLVLIQPEDSLVFDFTSIVTNTER